MLVIFYKTVSSYLLNVEKYCKMALTHLFALTFSGLTVAKFFALITSCAVDWGILWFRLI